MGVRCEECAGRTTVLITRSGSKVTATCGHDRASHYAEVVGGRTVYRACLCRGCECAAYVPPTEEP